MRAVGIGLLALSIVVIGANISISPAGETTPSTPGDSTPPPDLAKSTPKGQLKSPYQDFAKIANEGHHQFFLAGCNGCHGGTGGGGICPPLTQGVWFFGSDDDTLFRLVTLGTEALQKEGYKRLAQGSVAGTMPPMGSFIKTSDNLWKVIAWIRSINPHTTPPAPPPPGQ